MLKRILMIFLILSTLSYSAVWAADSHDDQAGGHNQQVSHSADSQHNDADHDLDGDHCCHASAHLTALLFDDLLNQLNINAGAVSGYQFSPHSHKTNPPYRPPLA